MNNHYLKLNVKHQLESHVIPSTTFGYGEHKFTDVNGDYWHITQCDTTDAIKQQLLSFVPEEYRHHFHPRALVADTDWFVHIDDRHYCNINFYVNTGQSITNFYEYDPRARVSWHGQGALFYDKLKLIDSFVPEDGDIYLINTLVPHGVTKIGVDSRVIYSLFTELPYSYVCGLFQEQLVS